MATSVSPKGHRRATRVHLRFNLSIQLRPIRAQLKVYLRKTKAYLSLRDP
jgi:hypothetical protein